MKDDININCTSSGLYLTRRSRLRALGTRAVAGLAITLVLIGVSPNLIDAETPDTLELRIALDKSILDKHPELGNGDVCEQLKINRSKLQRPPVDLLLICRTVQMSDNKPTLKILPSPSYARSLRMIKKGIAHTMAESVWFSDIDSDLMYHTGPVLAIGDVEKGIYVPKNHPILKQWQDISQLKDLRGITLRIWPHDLEILNDLTPNTVSTSHYESLLKMLRAGRGDFTLHEFSQTENLDIVAHDVWMKPLPGVKVVIPESRVIPISASAENASVIASIIKSGVQELTANGEISTLYSAVGFNNATVKDWQVINMPAFNLP